jgi:hypothetical protein
MKKWFWSCFKCKEIQTQREGQDLMSCVDLPQALPADSTDSRLRAFLSRFSRLPFRGINTAGQTSRKPLLKDSAKGIL